MNHVDQTNHHLFTGFEYTLIDIASQWGLDKLTFPERLNWAFANFRDFEILSAERGHWKEKPLFLKGVMALRRMQNGQPTGHMIGFDGVCSGMQVLSAMIGCIIGARSTGMVDPATRADAYTGCTRAMQRYIPALPDSGRADIKQACMTTLYGSRRIPESLFGEETPELAAFYQALHDIAPGASSLIGVFRNAWRSNALRHTWVLPDNHHADIPVMQDVETNIEIDELGHAKFAYKYKINEGSERGISLIANSTHSVDAYVLRSLIRRCNYDARKVSRAMQWITLELLHREMNSGFKEPEMLLVAPEHGAGALIFRWHQCKIADVTMINYLDEANVHQCPTQLLQSLQITLEQMSAHEPFPVACIHDEFKCHPEHMNELRMHYKEIMAGIAESDLLNDLLTQITKRKSRIKKLSRNLGTVIRQSNYALC